MGEYQLQDAFLSDPFSVNASYVMNAYTCFARTTGCRPGMAVNDVKDFDDPAGHWYEVPPLQMGSLQTLGLALTIRGALSVYLVYTKYIVYTYTKYRGYTKYRS